jgi:hypothetical protein
MNHSMSEELIDFHIKENFDYGVKIIDEVFLLISQYQDLDPAVLAAIFGNMFMEFSKAMPLSPEQFRESLDELAKIYEQ